MDKSVVKKYFDENSEYWIANSYELQEYTFPTALSRLQKTANVIMQRFPDAKARIADLGCGGGHLCYKLAAQGYCVTGVDASDAMIVEANAKYEECPKEVRSKVEFCKANILENGLKSQDYDVVTSLGVIGYLPDDESLFKEAARLLKKGGFFIVSSRNRLFNMVSISDYTLKEIDQNGAKDLIREIKELLKPVSEKETVDFLKALSKENTKLISDGLKDSNSQFLKNEKKTERTFSVDPRQHTPKGLLTVAEACGFEHDQWLGIHPHLLMAGINRLLPPYVFNALSNSLDTLDHHPLSLIWSSVILGVFRKSA